MKAEIFTDILGADFYVGVPDSQLKGLCDCLMNRYGTDCHHHIIAANEGNCTALAAGYHLATGKHPVVYMQNSGIGNAINPIASLLNDKVYAIPVIFVIGWRGEPGVHDEPQHIYQGEVTLTLMQDMDIPTYVIDKKTSDADVEITMEGFRSILKSGKSVAFIVRKGALTCENSVEYRNDHSMNREEVIQHILDVSQEDPIVCTTGKASRELFELREAKGQSHRYDFLTVGSMGHSSSIAMGIALNTPEKKIWCVDGDGAVLMHMGALAVAGAVAPNNMVHIVLNNESHETVGGLPTVAGKIDLPAIANACGYSRSVCVEDFKSLEKELRYAKKHAGLSFIEVKCALGARTDLGRPTTLPQENKKHFMQYVSKG